MGEIITAGTCSSLKEKGIMIVVLEFGGQHSTLSYLICSWFVV